MSGIATGSRTTSQIVAAVTDARWETYAGTAPRTATAPFVSVYHDIPQVTAQAMGWDQGQIRPRWRINGFAASMDQARWLQSQVAVAVAQMADVTIEQLGQTALDPTEQPDLYLWSIVFRDYQVVDG